MTKIKSPIANSILDAATDRIEPSSEKKTMSFSFDPQSAKASPGDSFKSPGGHQNHPGHGDDGTDTDGGSGSSASNKPIFTLDQIYEQIAGDSLQDGWVRGDGTVITYGFPDSVPDSYLDEDSNHFVPAEGAVEMVGLRQGAAIDAMKQWEAVINVTFVVADDPLEADIKFWDTTSLPDWSGGRSSGGGNIWVNANGSGASDYGYGGSTNSLMLHEIGHALGLSHPGSYDASDDEAPTYENSAEYQQDSNQYTVMSYFSESNTGADHNGASEQTPMLHDIYVVQNSEYDRNWETHDGNSTYGFNAEDVHELFDFEVNDTPVFTVWDAGGNDTFDFSGDDNGVKINLNEGEFSSVLGGTNNVSIAHLALIENGIGGDGDDRIIGNALFNTLTGNMGDDTITGGAGYDTINGGAGNDFLDGGTGNDTLNGASGNDTLTGGIGTNRLNGGTGSDTASYGDASTGVTVNLSNTGFQNTGHSTDRLNSIENLKGSGFADQLTGSLLGNDIDGGGGNDIINGLSGNDDLSGGDGWDTIDGGNGEDRAEGGAGNDLIHGGGGADTLLGDDGNDLLRGETGSDSLRGGDGQDILYGGDQNDTLIGGEHNDTLRGGDHDDTLRGDQGQDRLYGDNGHDRLEGGTGNDTLDGANGNDFLLGQDGHDRLLGGNGDDSLSGGGGHDTLIGGEGDDYYQGSTGLDTVDFTGADGAIRVDLGLTGPQYTWNEGYDRFLSIEVLQGSQFSDRFYAAETGARLFGHNGNDTLTGHHGADRLFGGNGNDLIHDRGGNDYIDGGDGIDTLRYSSSNAAVRIDLNLSTQNTIGAGVDTILNFENLFGSLYDDWLWGTSADNRVDGYLGNDILFGRSGEDALWGGNGDDILDGGADHDYLNGGAGNDTASYLTSTYGVNVSLSAGVEYVYSNADIGGYGTGPSTGDTLYSIENLIGSFFDDTLRGDNSANQLNAGAGNDVIEARGGDDVIIAGLGNGADRYDGGTGTDLLRFDGVSSNLTINLLARSNQVAGTDVGVDQIVNIENIESGSGNDTIFGDNQANHIMGGDGADRITGRSGADLLYGEGGDDLLNGGSGADTLDGGTGTDLLQGNGGNDVFVFAQGYGADTIADFSAGDVIDLTSFGFDSFVDDVMDLISFTKAGLSLIFDRGDSLTLSNVTMAEFDSGDVLI